MGFARDVVAWVSRKITPRRASKQLDAFGETGHYDSARTTDDNARHWQWANSLSAKAANSPGVRRKLRNRSRYEVANNSYAKGIVSTLANDTIGTGPRLQVTTDRREIASLIEAAFDQWSHDVSLPDKLRTIRSASAVDGESFLILKSFKRRGVRLGLDLIEADQVCASWEFDALNSFGDGIEYDSDGNPTKYRVVFNRDEPLRHPLNAQEIRAESVVHYFRHDRPGQLRGIPELLPALPLFAQLRRYTLSVLTASEQAAAMAGVLHTDTSPNVEPANVEPMDTIDIERGMLTTVPAGWRMSQMRAEQPTTSYAEFKHEILNEIARCLNMPFNIAAGNSAGYNYASGRLDHQTYFKSVRVEQHRIETIILSRIFEQWYREFRDVVKAAPVRIKPHWFWDGHEHVDPAKEASAQATRLANHTTTYADEYARRGLDWEQQLRQRSKELELMATLGLIASEATPATDDDEDDDAKE